MAKLTKRVVDAAPAGEADTFIWDDELRGFGLRVYPSGKKVYVAQCRANGRLRRINIGVHGPMTAELARKKAIELIAKAKNGGDPAAERDAERKATTVKELGERFLSQYVPNHCKPSTRAEYKRSVSGIRRTPFSCISRTMSSVSALISQLITSSDITSLSGVVLGSSSPPSTASARSRSVRMPAMPGGWLTKTAPMWLSAIARAA